MGRKRKRTQTKHNCILHPSSRRQKRRKRWYGTRRGDSAKSTFPVDHLSLIKADSLSTGLSTSDNRLSEIIQEIPPSCRSVSVYRGRLKNMIACFSSNSFFSCLVAGAYKMHHLATKGLKLRNMFLFLDWLRRITGCGLQKLGKMMLKKSESAVMSNSQWKEMVNRMECLENEVKQLRTERVKDTSSQCGHQSPSAGGTPQVLPPPPPPPPPPPALPPPIPPLPPPLQFPKHKQVGSKERNTTGSSKNNVKDKCRNLVTLEDLRKVKLRKVSEESEMKDKENTPSAIEQTDFSVPKWKKAPLQTMHLRKEPQCAVTLSEIQNVALKKAKLVSHVEKIKPGTPEEMLSMRRNLRKVNISRSPGGTPLVTDRTSESGSGLTPMMTKALRKKFQHACPKSPETSAGKRKRQCLSPLVDSSRSPSPLTVR